MPTTKLLDAPTTLNEVSALAEATGLTASELLSLAQVIAEAGIPEDAPSTARGRTRVPLVEWAEANYFIPESSQPIILLPHQKAILNYVFEGKTIDGQPRWFTTIIYSTIKKSGKTALAAMVARWVAEQWGPFSEVLLCANDYEQARGRLYAAVRRSVELAPGYDTHQRTLFDTQGNPLWRIIERNMVHQPTSSLIRAVSGDYRGEAGSNPNASFWSELWGFVKEDSLRLWEELTPVATRQGSFRWVETYAGHTNERGPLWTLFERARKEGRQLVCHDIPDWPWIDAECNCGTVIGCCPEHSQPPGPDDGLPLYINEKANQFAYWDTGVRARRMPWQQGVDGERYYQVEASSLRPKAYARLHENQWTESVDAFIPIEWWDSNFDVDLQDRLVARQESYGIEPPGTDEPSESVVLAADAAVSSDCCALLAVTRHPRNRSGVALRAAWVWYPPENGTFNYQDTLERQIRALLGCVYHTSLNPTHQFCAHWSRLNVVQLCYDAFQLHDMMTRLARDGLVWTYQFGQMFPRLEADKMLQDSIRDRRLAHPGAPALVTSEGGAVTQGLMAVREHLMNADSKQKSDEDTKLRIIKRQQDLKIDLAVALSMANHECLRLNL